MFYFILPTVATYNFILVIAAVIPAVILMIKTYRSDRLEREPGQLLWSLTKAGIFSCLIALVCERVSSFILGLFARQDTVLYNVILYFVIVALSEEGAKYFMLRRRTWSSPSFNCQYDGVVYAVFVSLGFALWENISYVMSYGFTTALIRALTAIPGHACFGVFMGVFYGIAKKHDNKGDRMSSKTFSALSVAVPALLHGAYDFIATSDRGTWYFVAFVALLFVASYILVMNMSKRDKYI